MQAAQRGWTLIELVVGSALLLAGALAVLLGMQYSMVHTDYLREYQVAIHQAQGRLEELAAQDFDTLRTGAGFETARTSQEIETFPLAVLPDGTPVTGQTARQIRAVDPETFADATQLDLHVAACWTSRGRTIGETDAVGTTCSDLVDIADPEEWVTSPAMVSTKVAQ